MSPYEYEQPPTVESLPPTRPLAVTLVALLCVLLFLLAATLLALDSPKTLRDVSGTQSIRWFIINLAQPSLFLAAGVAFFFLRRIALWLFVMEFCWSLTNAVGKPHFWSFTGLALSFCILLYCGYLIKEDRFR